MIAVYLANAPPSRLALTLPPTPDSGCRLGPPFLHCPAMISLLNKKSAQPIRSFLMLVTCLALCPWATAAEPTTAMHKPTVTAGIEGLLVLNNGGVLRGKVQRSGQWYRILQADHSLMEVRVERVESFYRTLAEAYQARLPQELQTNPRKYLALADWCLSQGLLSEANEQLQGARRLDPQHPELRRLEGLLQLKKSAQARPANREPKVPITTPITLATHQQSKSSDATEAFSLASRKEFVRSIQPMLVQGCATSGCHSPTTMPVQLFQLDRSALNGSGDVRLTMQNLSAVVAQLDQERLAESPLLQFAANVHGGTAEDSGPYEGNASKPLSQHQIRLLREFSSEVLGQQATGKPITAPQNAAHQNSNQPENVGGAGPPVRDEFDPAIFNRRRAIEVAEE